MNKYEITNRIEEFAPLETQEEWDCSGWAVDNNCDEVNKIMLCLTVTDDVVKQAKMLDCDMIISHHPCFYVPLDWSEINIYSAHTNLDKAQGGTTDTIIEKLNLSGFKTDFKHDFLRITDYKTSVNNFNELIKTISPNARITNLKDITEISRIAFCAGSGSEFIQTAYEAGADCFVTGDLKFHTALDSPVVLYDIGHFESEILILPTLKKLVGSGIEVIYAQEKSPFKKI